MHATNQQISDKFDNSWKKFKTADLLWYFAIYLNNLTL